MDVLGPGHEARPAPGRRGGAALLAIAAGPATTQIAEALLASGEGWRVARPAEGGVDRLGIKRVFDDLVAASPAIALVVITAPLALVADQPALVLAEDRERYPDEATLPLAWIGDRLRALAAPAVVIIASPSWPAASVVSAGLAALGPSDPLVIAASPVDDVIACLAAALAGAALDPTSGTVTLASLGRYLGAVLGECRVRATAHAATLVTPPPVTDSLELLRSRRLGAAAGAGGATTGLGTVLPGRFRLDEELARGSFGVVYRARQLAVDRDVAIKLLHEDIDPATADGRLFLHEIRAAGRLDHAHVVRIYQADVSHDGRLFFAMELLRGRTLAELTADGPLPAPRALALITQLLAGLAAAHEAGLVHADIKPANAMVVDARGVDRLVLLDFGLARLRLAEPAAAAGGTPAFMAPEQLREGRVDARSDVFAVGLVLVSLLTGWRRRSARELVPPLDEIADAHTRGVLTRALAPEPRDRFPSAAEFAAALAAVPVAVAAVPPRPPFVRLASLTEADHDRLRGRDRERAALLDHALFGAAVVVTAPSGVGKTSLLRAGVVPRLAALGVVTVYASGRSAPLATVIDALAAGAPDLVAAVASRSSSARVVVVLDQVEALLEHDAPELGAMLALVRSPMPDVAIVLSVREDFLARLLARPELVGAPAPVVRIGPIDRDSAEQAIVTPLAEHRIEVEPALLAAVLGDLVAAAASMGPELGWGGAPAVFPPHLQLVGAALFEALPADEHRLTLAHYRDLGGFAAVVGEHLERVLETELEPAQATIARELFLALVTTSSARATRTEDELVAVTGRDHAAVGRVLEVLRAQGLVVPVRDVEPSWELAHDSLVPRVQAWIDRHDLARRRAMEQVRYHLRRARGGAVSLLTRAELRELDRHAGALAQLDAEHARRGGDDLGPRTLVAQSRRLARRRMAAVVGLAVAVVGGVGLAGYDRYTTNAAAARERSLRDRDLGRVTLELRPFDWDPPLATAVAPGGRARDVEIDAIPGIRVALHEPDDADIDAPGKLRPSSRALIRQVSGHPGRYRIEASGGPAFLVIDGRSRAGEPDCGPSVIPVRALPGYAKRRATPPTYVVAVPTCQATYAGTIEIPAGPFLEGGAGEPPSQAQIEYGAVERETTLPAFRISRTELTNAEAGPFTSMRTFTGIAPPIYPDSDEYEHAAEPQYPVANVSWHDARALCRYWGRELPSSAQWQKAFRAGVVLADGAPNPAPKRNLPWITMREPIPANIHVPDRKPHAAPVGAFAEDVSPYGVLDLAGNLSEWTSTFNSIGIPYTRGGNWSETDPASLIEFLAIENQQPPADIAGIRGARCALNHL